MQPYQGSGGGTPPADDRKAFRYYRLAKVVEWISVFVTVLIILFLATAAYSASELAFNGISIPTGHATGGSMADLNTTVSISNPGYYSISDFNLDLRLFLPGVGLVTVGGTPVSSIKAGVANQVPIVLPVNLSSPTVRPLLTNNTILNAEVWVNGTYADLFPLNLQVNDTLSWGAPFHDLSYQVGVPVPEPNGTAATNVILSFTDDSPVPIVGTVTMKALSSSGAVCGKGTLLVYSYLGYNYVGNTTVFMSEGCQPSTVEASLSGPLLSIALPPERVP